jgi:hypothetical protein
VTPDRGPDPRRRLGKSEVAEGVADYVEEYESVWKGGARIGTIAEVSPFWK